ncbi:tetratricopeptide repeat-containing sensor histidine kinase [Kordia antarctica]|uniref:tetratricopeptide repeat-containing sensor histidine kinase n=1 Tax=Kordia antarctica TaxID=1218801 RepID=UPI001356CFD8|nr:tetratricopeptide repeat-containing sensor histidine kinase [Kordia antarctica]
MESKYEDAITIYSKALEIAAKHELTDDASFIYKKIGLIYYKRKKYKKAKRFFKQSITANPVTKHSADSYLNLSLLYRKQHEQDSVLYCLEKSLFIYNKLPSSKDQFLTYLKAGILYKNAGVYNEAIRYLIKAYKGFDKLQMNEKKASTANTIADTQRLLGHLDIAEIYYKESLKLRIQQKDSLKISYSYNNMGNFYKDFKRYDSAEHYYQKAIKIQEPLSRKKEIGRMLSNLASIYHKQEKYTAALATYKKALTEKRKEQDSIAIADTLNELAFIYLEKKDHIHAKNYLDTIKTVISSINNKDVLLRNLEINALYYESIEDFKESIVYHTKYKKLYTTVFNDNQDQNTQQLQQQFHTEIKDKQIVGLSTDKKTQEKVINLQEKNLRRKDVFLILLGVLLLFSIGIYFYLRQQQKIKQRDFELKKLHDIFKAQEVIKDGISKDLHDLIASNLNGIRLKMQAIPTLENNQSYITNIVNELKESSKQIRLISHRLSPLRDRIKHIPFREILISHLSEFQLYSKTLVDIDPPLPEELDEISIDAQTNFYAVFLEIINNIGRHAQATEVVITHFTDKDGFLNISISDNGIGILKSDNSGIGLMNIKNRVSLLGGTHIVESSDKGVSITIIIPLK